MSAIPNSFKDIIIKETKAARGQSLARIRRRDSKKPAGKWVSSNRIGSRLGNALSVVLSTQGCAHARGPEAGCTMCSYLLDGSSKATSAEDLEIQFDRSLTALDEQSAPLAVKIYTSGSFLDPEEVPIDARAAILSKMAGDARIEQVVLESRPEYVTESSMKQIREILGDRAIEIGIGLESSDDTVRSICINKGFTKSDFVAAVKTARKERIGTRAYVLVKPPFLTERDALLDSVQTIMDAADIGATTVSVNPVNVQKHTLVERLWSKGGYRPPWLWTVVEALKASRLQVDSSVDIICDPVAPGRSRGAHNCGKCDSAVATAIRNFSLSQDSKAFAGLDCECKSLWNHVLMHEDVALLVHSSALQP
ncbi:MAG: TIGR01210 family radical SAM protein [Candidatus Thorarchaeota archaeon]|nr:TIGR01210 family radical SAM protein [Candidatus Thorarchaeota archaeon]